MCYISLSLDDLIKTLILGMSRMGYCSPEALDMVKMCHVSSPTKGDNCFSTVSDVFGIPRDVGS